VDTWSALSAINRHAENYLCHAEGVLETFLLSRSTHEFTELCSGRVPAGLCGGKQLAVVISQWKTDHLEIAPKWIDSDWLNTINGLPKIKSTRTVKGQVEWEFSDKTKHDWSMLVTLLSAVDEAIEDLKQTESCTGKWRH